MRKLIVVVGLPGAGKSTLLKALSMNSDYWIVEDFMKDSISHSPGITCSKHYSEIVRLLRSKTVCVIADIAFCDTARRLELQAVFTADVADLLIEWRFFANDADACRRNVEKRKRTERNEELEKINVLSERYFIPEGAATIPVEG